MQNKLILLIVTLALNSLLIKGSDNENFFNDLIKKLDLYNKKYPAEKVYVQLDKEVYKAGDHLWFKSYIADIDNNSPTYLSKVLFIKIFNCNGTALIEEKFKIENSVVKGSMVLPDKLPDGVYTLIAYSSWMENGALENVFRKFIEIRNNQSDIFNLSFESFNPSFVAGNNYKCRVSLSYPDGKPISGIKVKMSITDGNKSIIKNNGISDNDGYIIFENIIPVTIENKVLYISCEAKVSKSLNEINAAILSQTKNITLSFFPESGHLLDGIKQLVAVRACDSYGKPVVVTGQVSDENAQPLVGFATDKSGFGTFRITAKSSNKLTAKITEPMNIDQVYALPEIKTSGMSLALTKKENDTLFFRLEPVTKDTVQLKCLLQAHGKIYYTVLMALSKRGILKVPVTGIPCGIAQIALFNVQNDLVAQRLVFIEHDQKLSIKATTDKSEYLTKSLTTVQIKVTGTSNVSFPDELCISVSKANQNEVFDNIRIATSYVLNPELTPDFYNTPIDDDYHLNNNINLFLLTTNYDRHSFADLKNMNFNSPDSITRDGVTGIVLDKKGKPVPNADVTIVNNSTLKSYRTLSDSTGWFVAPIFDLDNNISSYTFNASDNKGNVKYFVALGNKFGEEIKVFAQLNPSFIYPNYDYYDGPSTIRANTEKFINGVGNIIRDKEIKKSNKAIDEMRKKQLIDPSKTVLEIISQIKNYTISNNKIMFPEFGTSINSTVGARFVIDGVLYSDDISIAGTVAVTSIENIRVLTDPGECSRYTSFTNGIIEITTKKGNNPKGTSMGEIATSDGFKVTQKFLSPSYSNGSTKTDDPRTTLIWNPEIKLNKNGEATISFYNSDVKGKFVGNIEGIDKNGVPVKCGFIYNVK